MMERPEPTIYEFDLLVQVGVTSMNPVDCKIRQQSKMTRSFPTIGSKVSLRSLDEIVVHGQIGTIVPAETSAIACC